jgi:hypothetical protein
MAALRENPVRCGWRRAGVAAASGRGLCGTPDELARRGLPGPAIAVITGMRRPWRTAFSERDYLRVRDLGAEHQHNYPRRIAT